VVSCASRSIPREKTMADLTNSPFVPGLRVAITDGWDNWHEDFVEKVHKTGRFTLKGTPHRQWRPSHASWSDHWRADPSGADSWTRTWLRPWDEKADADIKEIFAKQARRKRRKSLADALARIPDDNLTDAMLDQIAAAVNIHDCEG
jgi:hypothetical protein